MTLAPSSYPRDAYGYVTSQAGHAYLVGVPAALALSWAGMAAPFIVGAAYAAAWELGYQRIRWPQFFDWRDSLEDSIHVLVGASVISAALAGDLWTVTRCLGAQWALLALGAWRRS